jgi:hypothetical protein
LIKVGPYIIYPSINPLHKTATIFSSTIQVGLPNKEVEFHGWILIGILFLKVSQNIVEGSDNWTWTTKNKDINLDPKKPTLIQESATNRKDLHEGSEFLVLC